MDHSGGGRSLRGGRSTEKSLFGNVTAFIGDKVELSGGLRYINYEDDSQTTIGGRLRDSLATETNATIYAVSAKYNFNEDMMVYANVGSSWRPGIRAVGYFSQRQSDLTRAFTDLPPEKSTSYEIGLKTSFLGRRGLFNIAAFHQDFANYAYRAPGRGVWYIDYFNPSQPNASRAALFNFVSAVPVKVDGIEAEANFKVTREWNIGANFSYARSRVKNGLIPCTDVDKNGIPDSQIGAVQTSDLPSTDYVGSCRFNGPAGQAPDWQATIQSEYARPILSNMDGYVRGLLNIYPSYRQDIYNSYDDVKNYTLLNLYAGIRSSDGQWEVSLFGKNILKTMRVLTAGSGPVTTPVSISQIASESRPSNHLLISTTAPREFGVNLRFAFGSR